MSAFLYQVATSVIPFVLVISLIVTVHELGHFLTARAFGTAIDRFSIGFGRALVSWRDRAGVEWRIGWIPLGGYVKFAGDENAASLPDQAALADMRRNIVATEGPGAERRYFHFKPLWQRALVILAGPAANFVLAAAIFTAFFMVFGATGSATRLARVTPGLPAEQAGFKAGDLIRQVDGRPLHTFEDLQTYVEYRPATPIDFTVERSGRKVHLQGRPVAVSTPSLFGGSQQIGRMGFEAVAGGPLKVDPLHAAALGVERTWQIAATTVFVMGRLATGHMALDQLHSVVGIVHASGAVTQAAISAAHQAHRSWLVAELFFLSQLAAVLSVSVGLLNLLPVPTLDGGHLIFYGYEWVAKRPAAANVQAAGYRAGLALLLALMLFATWNDLERLRLFRFIGRLFT